MADKQAQKLKVTQNKLPDSQVGLEIEISQDEARKAYDQAVKKLMRTANIPGFRKGKAPRKVVLRQVGAQNLQASTLEDLIQQTFEAAVKQEELTIIGNVQLSPPFEELIAQVQPGEAFTFTVSADVPPEIQLKRYQDFEVKPETGQFDPNHVDHLLENHRAQQATLLPVEDRPAQHHDVVLIDYHIASDPPSEGQAPEAESTFDDNVDVEDQANPAELEPEVDEITDFQLELSENAFLPDLVAGVIDMKIGETKDIPVSLPEQLVSEGDDTSTVFSVTLNGIKIKELPELDDDFAKSVSEFSTLTELRQFLEEQHRQEIETQTEKNITSALLNALLAELEVELPSTLLQEELNVLINEKAAQLQDQGIDINHLLTKERLPQIREELKPQAITRLKTSLALAEVARRESIQVSDQDIRTRLQEILQQIDAKVNLDRLKAVVEEELLQQEVLQWIREHSQVTLVDPSDKASNQEQPATAEEESAQTSDVINTTPTAASAATEPNEEGVDAQGAESDVVGEV